MQEILKMALNFQVGLQKQKTPVSYTSYVVFKKLLKYFESQFAQFIT